APVDPASLFGTGPLGEPAGLPDPGPGPLGPLGVEPVTSPQQVTGSTGSLAPDPSAGFPGPCAPSTGNGCAAVVSADRDYLDSVVAAGGPDAASIEYPGCRPRPRCRSSRG